MTTDSVLALKIELDRPSFERLQQKFRDLSGLDFSSLWPPLAAIIEKHVQKNIDQRRGTADAPIRKLSDATKLIRQKTGIPGVKPLYATGTLYQSFAIVESDAQSMRLANTATSKDGFPYPEAVFGGARVPITAKMRGFFWHTFGIRLRARSRHGTFGALFSGTIIVPPRNPYVVTPQMDAEANRVAGVWLQEQINA